MRIITFKKLEIEYYYYYKFHTALGRTDGYASSKFYIFKLQKPFLLPVNF